MIQFCNNDVIITISVDASEAMMEHNVKLLTVISF